MIRVIRASEADDFLKLCRKIDAETKFMMFESGERTTTVEEQRKEIKDVHSRDNQTILVAEEDGQLIGYVAAYGGRYKKNRHSAYIITGILQDFTSQGIGTRLFTELERWAKDKDIHRLELTVMANNKAAIAFYKKMGFKMEGRKRCSLFVNGSYIDEYWMAKLLP